MSDGQESGTVDTQAAVQMLFDHAAALRAEGLTYPQIEDRLVQDGLDPDLARTVTDRLRELVREQHAKAGQKNMLFGAMWCIGGTVVTFLTYQAAAQGGGGKYVVAWGAIVFGAVQFFQGLFQSGKE